jgi:hypothetical protein
MFDAADQNAMCRPSAVIVGSKAVLVAAGDAGGSAAATPLGAGLAGEDPAGTVPRYTTDPSSPGLVVRSVMASVIRRKVSPPASSPDGGQVLVRRRAGV